MQHDTILVIDDDPAILTTVTDILQFEGYRVVTATNGAEGLHRLEEMLPGLILLDMRMPVMDGWEFVREARERGFTPPIFVMTAAQDARRWAQEIGAAGFLAKPFDLPDLLATVEGRGGPAPSA